MSLYLDAVKVLESKDGGGSLKSRIYGPQSGVKAKAAVYALISETAKYDTFLKEVVDNAVFLQYEPKVSPLLAVLLVHDLVFTKGGISASSSHFLRQAIERHKARIQAEFTKARIRRKCANVEALKEVLKSGRPSVSTSNHVRWVRISGSSTLHEQLETTLSGYTQATRLEEVSQANPATRVYMVDKNIPSLLAIPPDLDLTKTNAYLQGKLILQDKASCFPAYLLTGDDTTVIGDLVDACAAPGNKTTHLSALVRNTGQTIYACERDAIRSQILQSMVDRAGASNVEVLAKQDFLALQPSNSRFRNVTHLLLDPSCSGSGILRREDVPTLALPSPPTSTTASNGTHKNAKKRKRDQPTTATESDEPQVTADEHLPIMTAATECARLEKLSNLQTQIINHAFKFPSAIRVSYSTCSVNMQENEAVVARVLQNSEWKLLQRKDQPENLRHWPHRGVGAQSHSLNMQETAKASLTEDDLEACIRCYPGDEHCTMGFFVCCFIKDSPTQLNDLRVEEDEWNGFGDT